MSGWWISFLAFSFCNWHFTSLAFWDLLVIASSFQCSHANVQDTQPALHSLFSPHARKRSALYWLFCFVCLCSLHHLFPFYFVKKNKKQKKQRESNFQRGFDQHHDFPPAHVCLAEGWVCDNLPALQFVDSKQEVSLAIKVLFSLDSRPKKQQSGIWRASTHPCLGIEQLSRGTVVNSAWGLPVSSLIVSRMQWRGNSKKPKRPKGQTGRKKGSLDESLPENFMFKIKPQHSII